MTDKFPLCEIKKPVCRHKSRDLGWSVITRNGVVEIKATAVHWTLEFSHLMDEF